MDPRPAVPAKARLLVADDEPSLLQMIMDALEFEGYEVRGASDGEQALEMIRADPPDVAIVDLKMPRKDGFAVCRELKGDPGFQHLPVIILSAAGESENKVQGLDSGADDFLTKPIKLQELYARVRMILRRTRQGLDANPLTRLPGNVMIENRVSDAIAAGEPFAVLYCDLNHFKAYNDGYGFEKGDHVIRETGRLLVSILRDVGAPSDFLGHIGGDDFILLTRPERMEALCKRIVAGFDALAPSFYDPETRARGRVLAKDRQGRQVEYPLLSISIGVAHNTLRKIVSFGQVSQVCAELKGCAKREGGSRYFIDRRRD
jgi:PleD family two-component response regulator